MPESAVPTIIQGGMGVGVSQWQLARAAARAGHLGVVSGVALDDLLVRRLQRDDPGGHLGEALAHFPSQHVARQNLDRYFVSGGVGEEHRHEPVPRLYPGANRSSSELTVAGKFAEIFLAELCRASDFVAQGKVEP